MTLFHVDRGELDRLALDLPKLGAKGAKVMHDVLVQGGEDLRDQWAKNAKATSGDAARFYPNSIESNLVLSTDIVVEVGPNPARKQGPLGYVLENGSPTSPAHNDGKKAADEIVPVIQGRAATALFHMFGLDS